MSFPASNTSKLCLLGFFNFVSCFSFGLFALRKEGVLFLFLLGGESALLQCSLKLINSQGKRSKCLLLCSVLVVQELTAVAGMVFTANAFSVAHGMKHSLLVSFN